jgi:hypothetical protein
MSDKTTVYWASEDGMFNGSNEDWGILNKEIESLHSLLIKNKEKEVGLNFFQCPSVRTIMQQTFVIRSPMDCSYYIENNNITVTNKNSISAELSHGCSIKDNILINILQSFYFFSEEDINVTVTSPFFNSSPHLQYGALVPGAMNIGSWFRSFNMEFNLWNGVKEFHIKENEPMAYVRFETEKPILLKKFKMNEELTKISRVCSTSSLWEKNVPLVKRYKRFLESKTNKVVLKEIEKRIIDE